MTTKAIDLRCAECGRWWRTFAHTKTLIQCRCGHVFAVWGDGTKVIAVDCGRWTVMPIPRLSWRNYGAWRRRP